MTDLTCTAMIFEYRTDCQSYMLLSTWRQLDARLGMFGFSRMKSVGFLPIYFLCEGPEGGERGGLNIGGNRWRRRLIKFACV